MAKNITLLGANYPDVPAVELPETGGGTATFTDITDTTAVEQDVDTGKVFYKASGVRSIGTGTSGVGKMDLVSNPTTGNVLITDSNGQAQDAGVEPIYYDTVASGVDTVIVGIDMDLLWTNGSPTSSFAAQTISLDLSGYSLIYIHFKVWAEANKCEFVLIPKESSNPVLVDITADYVYSRDITSCSNSGIVFGGATRGSTTQNNMIVPYKIYGIR